MKEVMPQRGINRTKPMDFFPGLPDGYPMYNRVERRKWAKKIRDYRGNTSRSEGKS